MFVTVPPREELPRCAGPSKATLGVAIHVLGGFAAGQQSRTLPAAGKRAVLDLPDAVGDPSSVLLALVFVRVAEQLGHQRGQERSPRHARRPQRDPSQLIAFVPERISEADVRDARRSGCEMTHAGISIAVLQ